MTSQTVDALLKPAKRGSGRIRNQGKALVAQALISQGLSRHKVSKLVGLDKNTLRKLPAEELISDDTAQYLEKTFKNRQILGKNTLLAAMTDPESIADAPLSHVALAYKALCASEERAQNVNTYVNIVQSYEKPSTKVIDITAKDDTNVG